MLIKRIYDYEDQVTNSLAKMKLQPPKRLVKLILIKYTRQLNHYFIYSKASLYIANKLAINTRYNKNKDTRKPQSKYRKYILNNKL